MFSKLIAEPSSSLFGKIQVPGDKSISHRALVLSSIAEGVSRVKGFLFGADNLATMRALQKLGVSIETDSTSQEIIVHGVGKFGLKGANQALEMGNSGTAMRLMMGLLAGQKFDSTLVGDESLSQRPMARVATPLTKMRAKIELSEQGTAPVNIFGGQSLLGIEYALPIPSAQVKSALLLAGLYATGETYIIEHAVSRDHTERMLQMFKYPVTIRKKSVALTGGNHLIATTINIPADISSAAFFMVAASIIPDSKILLSYVGINPTRIGIIKLLQAMGADIRVKMLKKIGEEPVADIEVTSAKLHSIDILHDDVALAIDEIPVIMIAAASAKGVTRIRGARELRVKETDRILAMATGLNEIGIKTTVYDDGINIEGGDLKGGIVDSFGDHRIAMSFAIAGAIAKEPITINRCENVATSFPGFVELAKTIGIKITGTQTPSD